MWNSLKDLNWWERNDREILQNDTNYAILCLDEFSETLHKKTKFHWILDKYKVKNSLPQHSDLEPAVGGVRLLVFKNKN